MQTAVQEAAQTLEELAVLRRQTRSLGTPLFPLLCFGAITALSAPLVAVAGTGALFPLWIVLGGGGMFLTARHYGHRVRHRGVSGRKLRTWSIAVAIFFGCLIAGVVGGTVFGDAEGLMAPIAVVLLGYLALGWLQHDYVALLAIAPSASLAAAFAALGLTPWIVELTFGVGLILAGAGFYVRRSR